MPLVRVNKARRLAGVIPEPPAELYAVAVRHLPGFTFAARAALSHADVPALIRGGAHAWAEHSVRVLRAGARARGLKPESTLVESFLASALGPPQESAFDAVYARILEDAANTGRRQPVAKRKAVPRVQVNPASVEWARRRGSKLIQDVSAATRETVRQVVSRALERGQRADAMVDAIRRAVGLTDREEAAVDRRRELLEAQDADNAGAAADRYADELRDKRALRIARTETVAAQNRGLLDGWREARDAGDLPVEVRRRWVSAPASPNPNRPCAICLEMNGQVVGLDEPFHSDELDEDVEAAPAHPNCRCTQTLKFSTGGGGDEEDDAGADDGGEEDAGD